MAFCGRKCFIAVKDLGNRPARCLGCIEWGALILAVAPKSYFQPNPATPTSGYLAHHLAETRTYAIDAPAFTATAQPPMATRVPSQRQRRCERARNPPAWLCHACQPPSLLGSQVGTRAAGADSAGRDSGSITHWWPPVLDGGSGGGSGGGSSRGDPGGRGWYWHGGGRSSDSRGSGDGGGSAPPTASSMALLRVSAREFRGVGIGGTRANSEKSRHPCTRWRQRTACLGLARWMRPRDKVGG